MLKSEKEILKAIKNDEWMMDIINTVSSLDLPQWIIGAGFIRNFIWDIQHDYTPSHENNDIDVIYFNEEEADWQIDLEYEEKLKLVRPDINWEVTNQAHIHTYNDNSNQPYKSAEDGLAHWTETATCTGITLKNGKLQLIAPWRINDLLDLKLRIPPCHKGKQAYQKLFNDRIAKKKWLEKWPKLEIEK
jgi:hypothetical protein